MFFGQPFINMINDFLVGMETAIIIHVGHLVLIIGIITVPSMCVSLFVIVCVRVRKRGRSSEHRQPLEGPLMTAPMWRTSRRLTGASIFR